jgi:hypothetical protein
MNSVMISGLDVTLYFPVYNDLHTKYANSSSTCVTVFYKKGDPYIC